MIPDKPGLLKDRFMIVQRPVSLIAKELAPCIPPSGYKKNWIVTMSDNGLPSFGKQIQIQPKRSTCTIVHWTSDCLSRPSEFITLRPCSGCDLNINKSSYSKKSVCYWFCFLLLFGLSSTIMDLTYEEIIHFESHIQLDCYGALLTPHLLTAGDVAASSSVVLSPDSQYTFYTDGSLINLVTSDRNIIYDWPSSSRAEAAAIYAALSASPVNSIVHIYTDSQSSIEGLKHCFLSDYSDSRLYYKTTNFELWAIIQQLIVDKQLSVLPFKVKAHSNFYWNDFADSLANTAHTSDDAILISRLDLATVHDYIMSYDDIVCESNPRHLFKQYHQMLYMKDLLALSRFHFISFLTDPSQYVVDWVLTWHTLMFQPKFDNSFTKENVSRHHTLKFQLFLEDLPTLESLKRTRSDLYVEILTCRSCEDHLEDFMHLFLCKKRRKQVIMPIVITLLQLIELLPSLAELFHQTTGLPIVLFVAVCLPPFWKFLKT
ncbi:ribonuclease H-like domain-containing protein [Rhizophagus irregularis DAOM 181602=DAOM 197198]|nr:ribonuclease H-like domain-containing protein [Rhizophagus irregularis DAOM 181602=DAOM 197198]